MRKNKLKILFGFILLVVLVTVSSLILSPWRNSNPVIGATLSSIYAEELGVNPAILLKESITELGIRKYRLPIYWSEVEHDRDIHDLSTVDQLVDIADDQGADLTIVVGQKVPRWPECFIPDWAEQLSIDERNEELLEFIELIVNRYKGHVSVERWQVENESFFPFGECPKPDPARIQKEIDLVRSLDDKPVQLTTSGEQAFWMFRAVPADVLGVSLYRQVHDENFGEILFPHTSLIYDMQRRLARIFADKVIISELQAEPWGLVRYTNPKTNRLSDAYDAFTIENLEENLIFADRTGVDEVYLWGIEWWYFLKVNDDSRLWDGARGLLN